MVSLWGSKNGEERHDEDEDPRASSSGSDRQPRQSEANERTRLLPPQQHGDGYLSPDDPAVSYSKTATPSNCTVWLKVDQGVPVQSLECPSSEIFRSPLPHDHLLVVGSTACVHFRKPTRDALSRLRLLRLLIHNPHHWKHRRRSPLLCCTIDSYGCPQHGLIGAVAR